ncbi:hypothetical protein SAMN05216201_10992 [Pseudomonas linyingensis]|uniref:Uncharacterized protein n=1 Tax=Pseudomonas linyingensis TaxID=915471 RepID=A0A1H6ZAX6_9PSED|nr:hypothetical protein [Pseudomonas linyingensis]SEJ46812.1 hypothetical protein SAMN05216201_10992 [Pseudomonas linyingensis]
MSCVDLLSNDVWSEADIVRRTEALVRSEVSAEAETILVRKLQGVALGVPLSAEDEIEVEAFRAVVVAAQEEGVAARADMIKLQAVLDHEAALARLALSAVEGNAEDAAERAAAQSLVDGASAETQYLYALRHPAPVTEGEPDA